MSASLVGSEMCIRDRDMQLMELHLRQPKTAEPRHDNSDATPVAHTQPCRCLLYTSDAADDM
eukprot:1039084-Alexandrium_andersonii.AAC.1